MKLWSQTNVLYFGFSESQSDPLYLNVF